MPKSESGQKWQKNINAIKLSFWDGKSLIPKKISENLILTAEIGLKLAKKRQKKKIELKKFDSQGNY